MTMKKGTAFFEILEGTNIPATALWLLMLGAGSGNGRVYALTNEAEVIEKVRAHTHR